jgi:hypothetical protein
MPVIAPTSASIIKSIQRGVATATPIVVSSVDVNKAVVNVLGNLVTANTDILNPLVSITNATTLTFTGINSNRSTSWELIEYV